MQIGYIQPASQNGFETGTNNLSFRNSGIHSQIWLNMFFQSEFKITLDDVIEQFQTVEDANAFGAFIQTIVTFNWQNRMAFTNCPHKRFLLEKAITQAKADWIKFFQTSKNTSIEALEYTRQKLKQLKLDAGLKTRF